MEGLLKVEFVHCWVCTVQVHVHLLRADVIEEECRLTEAGEGCALRGAHHVDEIRLLVGDDVVRITKLISGHVRVNHRKRVKVT